MEDLLSVSDLEKIPAALVSIFSHLNKKLRLSPYPIKRSLSFVECISKDLFDQLNKIIGNYRLMHLPFDEFEALYDKCFLVFRTWEEQIKEFTTVAREMTRKRAEKFIPIKVVTSHAKLQERLEFICKFRLQHEQLHSIFSKAVSGGNDFFLPPSALDDVNVAYGFILEAPVLNLTPNGTDAWVNCEKLYNDKISRVESQIISALKDSLAKAKTTREMLRVFSKFK